LPDRSSVVPDSTERSGIWSAGSRQPSKVDCRSRYFGGVRRSLRGVDSVRHSLTHLLRAGDHHGSSVVGERMAAGCPERPSSSTLTLVGTRRTSRPALSGLFDDHDAEAADSCASRPQLSRTSSGTDDQSDNESDGLTTTTAHLSELDTSDSFYESRLFDALDAQENNHDGGFETDSSDDGTYSADSFSDLAPFDDPPTSAASSDGSAEVVGAEARQFEPAETDRDGRDGLQAPAAESSAVVLRPATRQRSGSDVKSRRSAGESRCTLAALRQLGRLDDISDGSLPQRSWKRLSL